MATIAEALTVAVEHHQAGRLSEAEQIYRRILALAPRHADALHLLGAVAHESGQYEMAGSYISQAIELQPYQPAFHNTLGNVLLKLGRPAEAIACYEHELELQPDQVEARNNLGNALMACWRMEEALVAYQQAQQLRPNCADIHINLGNVLKNLGRVEEAIVHYQRAIQLQPDHAGIHSNLGNALLESGRPDEAIACYRRALELRPDFADAHSNMLLCMQYQPRVTLAQLATAHAEFEQRHAQPLYGTWQPYPNPRNPQGRLRLGFVSPDFGRHPVGFFAIGALENLSRDQCQIVCYSQRSLKDDFTARFRAAAVNWREAHGVSDEKLAEWIRADQIDILFDLAGHTCNGRVLVFARRPAPIQIAWIGYEGTTGLSAIDYLLADRHAVPENAEPYYRERILRLPDSYVCFEPLKEAPAVAPLPALASGQVTFGSFNNPAKLSDEVLALWAEILVRVPQSRLMLKYGGLVDKRIRRRILDVFARAGVPADRVELLGHSSHAECLATYHQVDMALDPFPFAGAATTCDALWMGVPVITCPGETFAGRHSLSYLSTIGLTETIAENQQHYLEIARRLSSDLPHLAAIRAGLRERMASSPLCDGPRFADNLQRLLREVWHSWLQSPKR